MFKLFRIVAVIINYAFAVTKQNQATGDRRLASFASTIRQIHSKPPKPIVSNHTARLMINKNPYLNKLYDERMAGKHLTNRTHDTTIRVRLSLSGSVFYCRFIVRHEIVWRTFMAS